MTGEKNIKKQLWIMAGIVLAMFAFCFALVPLYSVLCKATGLNGKTPGQEQAIDMTSEVDLSRTVTVEMLATLNSSLPDTMGEFNTKIKKFNVHPGEYIKTTYWIKNLTPHPIAVQAIPSVSPGLAASHVKKIECFCFQRQPLEANEGKEMPLVFTVDPKLPKDIHTITLAYTLFDITQNKGGG